MIIDIFNKILIFLLILSILNVVRTSFFLIRNIKENERFTVNKPSLIVLGMSISYILLSLIDGIKL